MNPHTKLTPRPVRARGFGIVEMMISMALSLLLMLATTVLFLHQARSYATQDDASKIVENARFLIQAISHDAFHAGYLGPNTTSTTNSLGASTAVSGTNDSGTINSSDSITFRFFGGQDSSGAVDASVVDCQGQTPASASTMVVDRFYIAADLANNSVPTLFCDNGSGGVALIAGVESMQVLYGEDATGVGVVTRYRPASTANMSLVKGLLVSVVLRSDTNNHPALANRVFNHFGSLYAPANAAPTGDAGSVFTAPSDNRIRRLFTFTVGLRNKLD